MLLEYNLGPLSSSYPDNFSYLLQESTILDIDNKDISSNATTTDNQEVPQLNNDKDELSDSLNPFFVNEIYKTKEFTDFFKELKKELNTCYDFDNVDKYLIPWLEESRRNKINNILQNYNVAEPESVVNFLLENYNDNLLSLLQEAPQHICYYFHSPVLFIELFHSHENDKIQLVIIISPDHETPEEALQAIDKFDSNWWVYNFRFSNDFLFFNIEYRHAI